VCTPPALGLPNAESVRVHRRTAQLPLRSASAFGSPKRRSSLDAFRDFRACGPDRSRTCMRVPESVPNLGCPRFGDATFIASGSATIAWAVQFPARSTGHFEFALGCPRARRSALGHAVSCGTSGSRCDASASRGCPRDVRIADGEQTRAVLAARFARRARDVASPAVARRRRDHLETDGSRGHPRVLSARSRLPDPIACSSPVAQSSSATSHDANARRTHRCRHIRPTSAPQHRDAHPTITPSPASSSDERTRCSCVVPRCAQFPARPGFRCTQFPARPVLRLVTSLTARLRRGVSSFSRP
jgi:hypothetical protein